MDLLFLLGQDGIIDHLSGEGMLEDVGRFRIDSSFIEELGILENGKVGKEFLFGQVGYFLEQLMTELPFDD